MLNVWLILHSLQLTIYNQFYDKDIGDLLRKIFRLTDLRELLISSNSGISGTLPEHSNVTS